MFRESVYRHVAPLIRYPMIKVPQQHQSRPRTLGSSGSFYSTFEPQGNQSHSKSLPQQQEHQEQRQEEDDRSTSHIRKHYSTVTKGRRHHANAAAPSTKERLSSSSHSLPHLTSRSTAHMVSVSSKPATRRSATAAGTVQFGDARVLPAIRSHLVRKGDVLGTARVAGIMGAKRCADIVPLCHPGLGIEHVAVDIEAVDPAHTPPSHQDDGHDKSREHIGRDVGEGSGYRHRHHLTRPIGGFGGVRIVATVVCEGKTGVEMEALSAVMAAGLTVVDMCKALDKGMKIEGVRLVEKKGGQSGDFFEPGWQDP